MDSSIQVDHAAELKALNQWINWQYHYRGKDKPDKVPVDPKDINGGGIDHTNPTYWLSYDEARENCDWYWKLNGLSFCLSDTDPYVGLDIDIPVDPETGEIPTLPAKLIHLLDSYAYLTPNKKFRIFVKGSLNDKGGDYKWVDPDNGEEYIFEVYDRKRHFTFTDQVINDAPIREAQEFLDSLTKPSPTVSSQELLDLSEIALEDEELEEARNKVKHLFLKWDLPGGQIREGVRRNTLRNHFRRVVRNDYLFDSQDSEGHLWQYLNWANETMLYDTEGEYLSPLSQKKLLEVYNFILEDVPDKAPIAVQYVLDELEDFLNTIFVNISYKRDKEWKALKSLQLHGRKYGSLLPNGRLRVDLGWEAFRGYSRMGSKSTLDDALKRFVAANSLQKGKDKEDRTGHFILDPNKLMDLSYWEVDREIYEDLYQGEKNKNHYLGTNSHISHSNEGFSKDPSIVNAIVHTTWYRGVGPSETKYILALYHLQCKGEEATREAVARLVGVQPGSVCGPMKKLENDGIIYKKEWGKPYRLKENFVGEIYRLRSNKNEFSRDEQAKQERKDNRSLHRYQLALEARIFYYIHKVGFDSGTALIKARDKTKEPILGNILDREYRLSTHQQRALKGAIRKHNDLQDQKDSTEEEMKERFEDE